MLHKPQIHTVETEDAQMEYAVFGKGERVLVMIPGLNLKSVREVAIPFAYMYRIIAEEYRVYIIDRRINLPEAFTVRDIARDVADAMRALEITKADVLGISQGGMIGQYLAMDAPSLVNKLVLGVTLSRENETVKRVIGSWIAMSEQEDYEALAADMLEKMYSKEYKEKYGRLIPLLSKAGKPKDMHRFTILAKACLTCQTYEKLEEIKCPVLVIGGRHDEIVTAAASEEIAEKLGCEIYIYEDLGHSVYEEARDFNERVLYFLNKADEIKDCSS